MTQPKAILYVDAASTYINFFIIDMVVSIAIIALALIIFNFAFFKLIHTHKQYVTPMTYLIQIRLYKTFSLQLILIGVCMLGGASIIFVSAAFKNLDSHIMIANALLASY